jgi:hypothetical protein
LTVTNSTLSGNASDPNGGAGGGIFNQGKFTVENTIIADNTGNSGLVGASSPDVAGAVTSRGHNLIGNTGDSSGFSTSAYDVLGRDPLLGPLQDNGGLTLTMLPLVGSPALRAGDVSFATATDQRGLARVVNGTIDIEAVEVQTLPTHFQLVTGGTLTLRGQTFSLYIAAVDYQNNLATNYAGTVRITSSDGLATSYTITGADKGVAWVSGLALHTAGRQIITVTDSLNNLTGSLTLSVLGPTSASVREASRTWLGSPSQPVAREQFTNFGAAPVTGPFQVLLEGLQPGQSLINAALVTPKGQVVSLPIYYTVTGAPVVSIPLTLLSSLPAGVSFQLVLGFDNLFSSPWDYKLQVAVGAI